MDPDADSISFRLFNEEIIMSIREWSLRMGLFTSEEDDEGIWNERMFGPPKNIPGFKPQEAWELITHKRGGTFKTSMSKGSHITNHLLHFAQVFIGYNLMGTASSALTTPELYFAWCMTKKIKVHLGYWLAQAFHLMTSNTSRHLYTCHLLGAYLQRNVVMKIAKSVSTLPVCDPPELFNVDYFFNKGLLYMHGGEVFFYEIGKTDATVKLEDTGVTSTEIEVWRKEMGTVKSEISEIQGGVATMTSAMLGLKGAVEKQTEKMAEALSLMMRMVASVEQRYSPAQQIIPSGSSGGPRSPAPGRPVIPQAPLRPTITASKKRKEYTTTPTTAVPVMKRDTPKPTGQKASQEDEPVPPPPKKPKVTARKSGPPGDQTQK